MLAAKETLGVGGTQQGRSKIEDLIKETLDEGLPQAYDRPLHDAKLGEVFAHFFRPAA